VGEYFQISETKAILTGGIAYHLEFDVRARVLLRSVYVTWTSFLIISVVKFVLAHFNSILTIFRFCKNGVSLVAAECFIGRERSFSKGDL
jgi:hypothetical protein